jgi:Protein of unknown function
MTDEIEREVIAERTIYAIDGEGRGTEVHLILGKPYQSEQGFKCPVAAIGLPYGDMVEMKVAGSWKALMLAQTLLRFHLSAFVKNGGTLYWEKGGAELDIEYLFRTGTQPWTGPVPTDEEYQANIDSLTAEELEIIDQALLAHASHQFRKVARVVGSAMTAVAKRIPDTFYAHRVKKLVSEGRLIAKGDLDQMGRSEVRLP